MYPHIYAHTCKKENPGVVAFTCHPINEETGGDDRQISGAQYSSTLANLRMLQVHKDPVSNKRWTLPKNQLLRLSPGLRVHTNTCVNVHVTHMNTSRHDMHIHTKAYLRRLERKKYGDMAGHCRGTRKSGRAWHLLGQEGETCMPRGDWYMLKRRERGCLRSSA